MPTKPGGGDHPENYDEETGKYVSTGKFKAPDNLFNESQKPQNKNYKGTHYKVEQKIANGIPFEEWPQKQLRTYFDMRITSKAATIVIKNRLLSQYPEEFGANPVAKINENEWMDMRGVDFIINSDNEAPLYIDLKSTHPNNNTIKLSLFLTENDDSDLGFYPMLLDDPKSEFFTDSYLFMFLRDKEVSHQYQELAQKVFDGTYSLGKSITGAAAFYVDAHEFKNEVIKTLGSKKIIYESAGFCLDHYKTSGLSKPKTYPIEGTPFNFIVSNPYKGAYQVQLEISRDYIEKAKNVKKVNLE